ncbi:MAG: hypothetical protein M3Q10_05685 [Chloroflexota bacterium]|nr:hypothetical protein [Chloroflexota bacterium]
MRSLLSPVGAALLLVVMVGASPATLAQDGTPRSSPQADGDNPAGRLDLAAMALGAEDVPATYGLSYFVEEYLRGDVLTEQLPPELAEPLADVDLRWSYDSQYGNEDGSAIVCSYLLEYGSEDDARAGFDLLEDETVGYPEGSRLTDEEGPGVGTEPSETTVGTVGAEEGIPETQIVDATFRIGQIIAGVAMETTGDEAPDEALVRDLAAALADRIEAVLAGRAPVGIDPALPGLVLPTDEEWPALGAREGYLAPAEAAGRIDPAGGAFAAFESGYYRTVRTGASAEQPFPSIAISVLEFADDEAALAVVGEGDLLPPGFPMEPVNAPDLPGADAAAGFRFGFPVDPEGEPEINSFRVVAAVGPFVTRVEVRVAEDAEAAALGLAAQQVACLAEGACASLTVPAALAAPNGATPEAG